MGTVIFTTWDESSILFRKGGHVYNQACKKMRIREVKTEHSP